MRFLVRRAKPLSDSYGGTADRPVTSLCPLMASGAFLRALEPPWPVKIAWNFYGHRYRLSVYSPALTLGR